MYNIEEKTPGVITITLPTVADSTDDLFCDYPELMSTEQVAKALGVSLNTVRSYLNNGVLPGRKVLHKWVVPRQALRKWLMGQDVEAALPPALPKRGRL